MKIEGVMILNRRKEKQLARKERLIQRSGREDAAGKLVRSVPDLTNLSIAIHEARPDGRMGDTHYIRRVVIEQAPALFELSCSDPECEDGGYDVTREILLALASRQAQFEGTAVCRGRCGAGDCARVLRYVGTATYREGKSVEPGQEPRRGTAAAT